MLQVLPFILLGDAVGWIIRLSMGENFPGWSMFIAPFLETLLWPVANSILLAPQRRAHNPDENRPI
jgi:rod shape-determining protein MreD